MKTELDENGQEIPVHSFYESKGLYLDDNGNIEEINVSIFAEHICQKYKLVRHNETLIYRYKGNYYQKLTEDGLKRLIYRYWNRLVEDSWKKEFESAYLPAILRHMGDSSQLRPGNDYINVTNGLVRISGNWKLEDHSPDVFTTIQIPVVFDPKNVCPQFDKFMEDVFVGDKDLIKLAQEIMGYCLCDNNNAQKFFILYGSGSNGKSVFCWVIEALVGSDNATAISLPGLTQSFEVADIVDKRVNIATENDTLGRLIRTDKLKQISSGDSILINPKGERPFKYRPSIKLIFAVNNLPKTLDTSPGFIRRLCILSFSQQFSPTPGPGQKQADPELIKKLEGELGGILNFALKGLHRLQKNGYQFTKSEKAEEALREYLSVINPYIEFVKTCIALGGSVPRKVVFEAFKQWSNSNGSQYHANLSAHEFYPNFLSYLESDGIAAHYQSGGERLLKGVSLKDYVRPRLRKKKV